MNGQKDLNEIYGCQIVKKNKRKICKECKKELNGKMIFYPKLCLSCVIELHCT